MIETVGVVLVKPFGKKEIKANSERAKKFVDLYLNPVCSHVDIMTELNISKATFYRLVRESKIQSMPVALLSESDLPQKSELHWRRFHQGLLPRGHEEHILTLLEVAKKTGLRFETKFLQTGASTRLLNEGKLGASFASMTYSPGRFDKIDFSYSYLKHRNPMGVFIGAKKFLNTKTEGKPHLGLLKDSMLDFYATKNDFHLQFKIRKYLHAEKMTQSLQKGHVDIIFDNPCYHNFEKDDLIEVSDPIYFGGHTGVAFSQAYEKYRREFNLALEKLDSEGFLDRLAKNDS